LPERITSDNEYFTFNYGLVFWLCIKVKYGICDTDFLDYVKGIGYIPCCISASAYI